MRHHPRRPLPARALEALRQWQDALDVEWARELARPETERRAAGTVADAHWSSHRSATAFDVVRLTLRAMASPRLGRCMYCETDRGSQVDHGRPKSLAPGLTFVWHNHIWACALCNQQKTTRYDPAMIDPTIDDPLRYLDLVPSGRWDPEDDDDDEGGRGQATLDALPMLNHPDLVEERLQGRARLLRRLSALAAQASVSTEALDMLREEVTNDPFSDVFAALLDVLRLPNAAEFYPPAVVDFVRARPEMNDWLAESDERRWRAAQGAIEALALTIRLSS